jgi:hypothetical protein
MGYIVLAVAFIPTSGDEWGSRVRSLALVGAFPTREEAGAFAKAEAEKYSGEEYLVLAQNENISF